MATAIEILKAAFIANSKIVDPNIDDATARIPISIINPGEGYTVDGLVDLIFTRNDIPGVEAAGQALIENGRVKTLFLSVYGTNYTGNCVITVDQAGSPIIGYGAELTAVLAGGVLSSISIVSGGVGFLTAPQVLIIPKAGDPGTGAHITVTLTGGVITGYTIVNAGSGYVEVPDVYILQGKEAEFQYELTLGAFTPQTDKDKAGKVWEGVAETLLTFLVEYGSVCKYAGGGDIPVNADNQVPVDDINFPNAQIGYVRLNSNVDDLEANAIKLKFFDTDNPR